MTPLDPTAWEIALHDHPDRAYVRFLLTGIKEGFRIGFNQSAPLQSATANMPSALEHPQVVRKYLKEELGRGRLLGPFGAEELRSLPPLHINRFGVIPKGHNSGKWRLITDLSFPPGRSVNDGIAPELCSLTYASVENVAEVAAGYRRGALMAKIDIESAYRLVPVHPTDRIQQAVEWEGNVYVDLMLPFGLRSAPKLFNAVADGLEWYLRRRSVQHVFHYLDDFIVVAAPASPDCAIALDILNKSCADLGLPIAEHKRAGPTTCLVFLGIEVDTMASQLRLPTDKLQRLKALLADWGDKKTCSRKELESLIGLLNHACKVVRAGRSFLRRMIDLLYSVPVRRFRPHPIRLNRGFRSDLTWWHLFVERWNETSFLPPPAHLPALHFASDASGSWGCGAWFGKQWFQVEWDHKVSTMQIMTKELIPVVLACAVWGAQWRDHRVICHCDNQAVVAALGSRSCRDSHCMHLLRALVFVEAQHAFQLQPVYIQSTANDLADDLSRNKLTSFLSKVPQAGKATPLSTALIRLLLDQSQDWTSPTWLQQFRAIFSTAWPLRQGGPITQQ